MRFFSISLVLVLSMVLAGCCANNYGTAKIDCNESLQCDIQRFFCIDEFTLEYWHNTFNCPSGHGQRYLEYPASSARSQVQAQTASQAQSTNVIQY